MMGTEGGGCEDEGLVEQVRRVLAVRLEDGDASVESVARALRMSQRTLQRRLSAHRAGG
jgi:AraC-like DNA-binding protein